MLLFRRLYIFETLATKEAVMCVSLNGSYPYTAHSIPNTPTKFQSTSAMSDDNLVEIRPLGVTLSHVNEANSTLRIIFSYILLEAGEIDLKCRPVKTTITTDSICSSV